MHLVCGSFNYMNFLFKNGIILIALKFIAFYQIAFFPYNKITAILIVSMDPALWKEIYQVKFTCPKMLLFSNRIWMNTQLKVFVSQCQDPTMCLDSR